MAHGMTIAEKILAAHAGLDRVVPGQLIECDVDIVLANDITAPMAIKAFESLGVPAVFDSSRIALVADHYCPNKDIKSAVQAKIMRDFARRQGITHFFDVGRAGIEHALLPEQGTVTAGDLVIGADSHTCTYGAIGAFSTGMGSTDVGMALATGRSWFKVPESVKVVLEGELARDVSAKDVILHLIGLIGTDGALYQSLEFCGPAAHAMGMEGRMTISNMAVECGAKAGIFPPDDTTIAYLDGRSERPARVFESDPDAEYAATVSIDCSALRPTVSLPHSPANTKLAAECGELAVDQAVIGSCTNGRIEDLRMAARILEGRKVAEGVRCIVIPATQAVYRQALAEGLIDVFLEAECAVSTPTCGPCLGGHMGVLAPGERCVATTNRNFVGRMGDATSEVVLASPAVAAASAVLGRVADPAELDCAKEAAL